MKAEERPGGRGINDRDCKICLIFLVVMLTSTRFQTYLYSFRVMYSDLFPQRRKINLKKLHVFIWIQQVFFFICLFQEADETLNFDEMILEAAKSIAAATSALVKAASAAQRELIDSGRVSRKATSDSDDGQWSDGLVSAAQLVAAATHSLVEAANSLVQGNATEEKLISAAKQVASSTAQLLIACKVKASPDSDSTRRLQVGETVDFFVFKISKSIS